MAGIFDFFKLSSGNQSLKIRISLGKFGFDFRQIASHSNDMTYLFLTEIQIVKGSKVFIQIIQNQFIIMKNLRFHGMKKFIDSGGAKFEILRKFQYPILEKGQLDTAGTHVDN